VDDGLAFGYTLLAAAESVKRRNPARIIVAVPAASEAAVSLVEKIASRVVTVETAHVQKFYIADYYRYWNDLSDAEGVRCYRDWLARRNSFAGNQAASQPSPIPRIRKGLF
jgi:predicted phosphoribosyltransferase